MTQWGVTSEVPDIAKFIEFCKEIGGDAVVAEDKEYSEVLCFLTNSSIVVETGKKEDTNFLKLESNGKVYKITSKRDITVYVPRSAFKKGSIKFSTNGRGLVDALNPSLLVSLRIKNDGNILVSSV